MADRGWPDNDFKQWLAAGNEGLPSGMEFDPTEGSQNLTLGNEAEDGSVTITAAGIGSEILLTAADGDEDHVGGEVTIRSGDSEGQSSGAILITTGDDDEGGDSGAITIQTGAADGGSGGDIDIKPNAFGGTGVGGNVNIVAGSGETGSGGDVIVQAGDKTTGGTHGSVQLYAGGGVHSAELASTGFMFIGGVINMEGIPTSNPNVAGQIWSDSGTLKISAG